MRKQKEQRLHITKMLLGEEGKTGKTELKMKKNQRNCKFYIYQLGPGPETISMVCDEKGGNPHNKKDSEYSM